MHDHKLFYKFFQHILDSFKVNYGLNYILGAILTFFIVASDIDNFWFKFSLHHFWVFKLGFFSVVVGGLFPLIVPISVYIYAHVQKNLHLKYLGAMLGQAAIIGWGVSSFIKIFTGRVAPVGSLAYNSYGGFRFGFYRGGVFSGWPSSHTAVAFTMMTALAYFYPENKPLKYAAYTYAAIIAVGVSTNIHWLSDAVMGALIGYALGKVIGMDFKNLIIVRKKGM